MDATGLRGLEPNLAHDLAGAIYYLDEAQVDARAATLAMLDAAQNLGATSRRGRRSRASGWALRGGSPP